MGIANNKLIAILRIGHDTSMRGEGLSLQDAIARAGYDNLREEFTPSELVPLLRANPELMTQWVVYSEDKRTDGGYWISEKSHEVGSLASSRQEAVKYESLEEAVANFVVRELDFWCDETRKPWRRSW